MDVNVDIKKNKILKKSLKLKIKKKQKKIN